MSFRSAIFTMVTSFLVNILQFGLKKVLKVLTFSLHNALHLYSIFGLFTARMKK